MGSDVGYTFEEVARVCRVEFDHVQQHQDVRDPEIGIATGFAARLGAQADSCPGQRRQGRVEYCGLVRAP
jgi:hypothetical protein